MPVTLVLVAGFQAKPGREDQLRAELNAMIEPSLAEDACLGYRPLADPNRPGAMVCLEEWADEAGLRRHFATPHFKRVSEALGDILTEPFTLRRLAPVADSPGS